MGRRKAGRGGPGGDRAVVADGLLKSYYREAAYPRLKHETLEALFAEHGAPLVYKSDNCSAFIAEEFKDMLKRWQVIALLSPPCTPRYNGFAEAGIGSLKTRIFYQAAAHGACDWTSDDVEGARQQTNCAPRPYGQGLVATPQERWQLRAPITHAARNQFRQTVRDSARQTLAEHYLEDEPLESISPASRAVVAREAIRRAPESLGYSLGPEEAD